MLTPKRHALIIELIKQKQLVTIQELVELTNVSESTIRRDLSELETKQKLARVHGGATAIQSARQELSYREKTDKYVEEKKQIAQLAAALIRPHDCIYLDAGTTTYEIIPHLETLNVTVVTNGLTHLELLNQYQIKSFLLGGLIKHTTRAIIGSQALHNLKLYHFDKVFIGTNAIDPSFGYSTPDPEEASVKSAAITQGSQSFIVADHSKLNQRSFAKIAELAQATLIIDSIPADLENKLREQTDIKVVTA
ncbi:DeoR/GlpR family DNA-binding transcription regulator [Amphibacillus sediminis]|uniref:DeoR/GlpR family DNA-binding transcription regulator n=1 Tax=Amphibacillus sediminis TaxID=360185 RepID=UPI0008360843|nr:DeoR/GlpR family DNA-binding transcription regulator [Amphibacillus sediminis]